MDDSGIVRTTLLENELVPRDLMSQLNSDGRGPQSHAQPGKFDPLTHVVDESRVADGYLDVEQELPLSSESEGGGPQNQLFER